MRSSPSCRLISWALTERRNVGHGGNPMEPRARAESVWYRTAGLATRNRKDLAVDIIESEIRSAMHEVWLEAAKLVLTDNEPIAIARRLRELAERTIRPKK